MPSESCSLHLCFFLSHFFFCFDPFIFSINRVRSEDYSTFADFAVCYWNILKTQVCSLLQYLTITMAGNWQPQVDATEMQGGPVEGGPDGVKGSSDDNSSGKKKKIVIIGLGMVGISFM